MGNPSVVVLGGGLSGVATAYALGREGWRDVTVVERGPRLGGLAGSFEQDGRFYPLGYHHVLSRDQPLQFFLDRIGVLERVRWRHIRMLFEAADGALFDLANPADVLRFPMKLADKARLAALMARAWRQRGWAEWEGRSAAELLEAWASPGVRQALFEPLTQLKFDLPCREVSAAWMGERLRYREGSDPLGYVAGANWTTLLCDGVAQLLAQTGAVVRLRTNVEAIHADADRVTAVELSGGETLRADLFVSTLPTVVYAALLPDDETAFLRRIRYTALLSLVCATRPSLPREFYWLNLSSLSHTAGGLFVLNALNPTIGAPGETTLNFVSHLPDRSHPLFSLPEPELLGRYADDLRSIFGVELAPHWRHLARIPYYSPVFDRLYHNPPMRSGTYGNVRFAGTYRTHPSVASTGTALQSGLDCAEAILAEHGQRSGLAAEARRFRPVRRRVAASL